MKRRDFFKTLLGTAAAVAIGPKLLELAEPTVPFEMGFVIPPQEVMDWMTMPSQEMIGTLVANTAQYWNELMLKNLDEGLRKICCNE